MEEKELLDQRHAHMMEDPVEGLVIRMAVPTIITMLISAMYNMADTYFVGSLGTSATAAVGVTFALMAIIQAVGFLFGHGAGTFISRELGAQSFGNAAKMAATGFYSAFLAGTVLGVAGLLFMEPLARFLGSSPTMLSYTCEYLQYILIAAPFMTGSLMLNNLLRFQGSAVYGMVGMVTGAVLNIVLDPLFIFVFHMGVGGAALATMISQIVGCVILYIGCNRKGNITVSFKNFAPSLGAYKQIFRGGTPALLRQSLGSVASICLNQMAVGHGDAAVAAISIVSRVNMFASSALLGFGQGFQPVCGFNYGAGRYDRVRRAFWFCVKSSVLLLLALAALGVTFAPQIIALFRKDDLEVIAIGTVALRLQCVVFPCMGWVILCNMMMQSTGRSGKASILSAARQGLFFLPALYILVPWLGIFGLQLTQPAADLSTVLLSIPLGVSVLRELKLNPVMDG